MSDKATKLSIVDELNNNVNAVNPLPVKITDAAGNQIISFGSPSTIAEYISPVDFTVTYTSSSTLTLSGLPFTLASGVNIVYVKVRNSGTNVTNIYVNGSAGYAFAYSSGVTTVYLNGVIATVFTSNDMYEVGLNGQRKAYDSSLDIQKVIDQSPDRLAYVSDSLVDTTNVAAGTSYYPSTTGMSMDGYKDLSITGKIIEGDAVTDTIEIQGSNDEDFTNADWVTCFFYRSDTNATTNIITTGGVAGTYTFAIDFDNFNYSSFRVKLVTADSTNTVIIKARRKAL